jgi:hypothetical protein
VEAVFNFLGEWTPTILGVFAVGALLRKQIVEWMRRSLGLDEKGGRVEGEQVAAGITMEDLTSLKDYMTTMFEKHRAENGEAFAVVEAKLTTVATLERTVKNGLEARTERVEAKTDRLDAEIDRLIEGQARLEGRFDQRRHGD